MKSALVVCIGNDLVADDGIGYAIYDELVADTTLPESTRLKLLGLGGMDVIEEINGEDLLIVVDALQLGFDPGTVHVLSWSELPYMEPRPVSGHGIGIREAIEVAKRLYTDKVPKEIYLVGIEGKCFNQLGEGLTPIVSESVPGAVLAIRNLISK